MRCLLVFVFGLVEFSNAYIFNPGPYYVASKGEIWPRPQHQQKSDDYFVLSPRDFQFLLNEDSDDCLILRNAFTRYFKIFQQNTIPRFSKRKQQKDVKMLHEGEYLGVVRNLTVNLQGDCDDDDYPDINVDEKYQLNVTTDSVLLSASSVWGILCGLESFSQLLYLGSDGYTVRLNSTVVVDYPRYRHRGLLLDTSRHYIPLTQIYQVIDGLAYNKMNVFHWHLVDDQSFPFVSQTFPELSQLGAYDPLFVYDSDDVQSVIEYARLRGIRVMPEIDTPGHTRSWGVSHPELLTNCSALEEGALGPLDPTKEGTYEFLKDLLGEVKDVFKDQFIHLGGDEVGFECWQSNSDVVAFMKAKNITTYEDLESYYIQKVIDIADNLTLKSIVWEEVFVNGVSLPKNTIVHVWRAYGDYNWEGTMRDNNPTAPTVLDDQFDIKKFKKIFRVVIVRYENNEMEFDLIGIHPFLANTFRRLIISDVPSMAIEKVHILNNTSIIQDEVLAHRLGLIPLKADPRFFEYKTDWSSPPNEKDTLEFELKIKCSNNKDSSKKESSRAEDIYKNSNVYSKHIKWVPIGNQKKKFKDVDVGSIHPDILIAKMRPGHELDLKLFAVKSNGKDHAKFCPVATAFYRLLPEIKIVKPVKGDAAYRLQQCFSPGVISVRSEGDKKYAVVKDARYDTGSRNVFKYDDLKDSVVMSKIQDHFIFTIESVGAMQPDIIFKEAVTLLKEKCLSLLNELNS